MTDHTEGSVIDVYQRYGAAWAKLRDTRLVERPWIDRFCALIPAGGAVLDIGCGSGLPVAGELIERGFDVAGVDGARRLNRWRPSAMSLSPGNRLQESH
jgi:hypothetical protein